MKKILSLALVGFLMSGCLFEDESPESSNSNDGNDNSQFVESLEPLPQIMQGEWVDPCEVDEDGGSEQGEGLYEANRQTIEYSFYGFDSNCENLDFKLRAIMDVGLAGTVELDSGKAYQVNGRLHKYETYLASDLALVVFNGQEMCGKSDWEKGKYINVSGCADLEADVLEEIFDLEMVLNDKLYAGDESTGDGSSESNRPTGIDYSDFQVRP